MNIENWPRYRFGCKQIPIKWFGGSKNSGEKVRFPQRFTISLARKAAMKSSVANNNNCLPYTLKKDLGLILQV